MAHVVPKRDPCVKCNNPVFFAERLVINSSLYHRTCFKCARCTSVLTLGNYYETENDHEYCCETCPDEEKLNSAKVDESNRLSIAQRIALFEKESSSVLKKSLSDEEKSKSLSRQAPANSGALNSFLSTQIDGPATSDCDESKTTESISSESESEDDEQRSANQSDDIIPSSISDKNIAISDHNVISESPDNFVVTKELTNGKDVEAIDDSAATNCESQNDIASAHVFVVDKKVHEASPLHDDIELEFEKLAEDALVPAVITKASVPVKIVESEEKTEKEVRTDESSKPDPRNTDTSLQRDTTEVTTTITVLTTATDTKVKELTVEDVEVEESLKSEVKSEEPITLNDTIEESSKLEIDVVKEESEEVSIVEKSANIEVVIEAATPTVEQSLAFTDDSIEDSLKSVNTAEQALIEDPKTSVNTAEDPIIEQPLSVNAQDYPDDLDPFGDEEDPKIESSKLESKEIKPPSLNPFGSGSEDEENVEPTSKKHFGTLPRPPRPPLPKTMTLKASSTNPFGSEDEEDEPQKPMPLRTPVPTPRKPFL